MKQSLVIIPTFNEKENISHIIDAVVAIDPALEILVVDDNSPDGTASIVKLKQDEYPGRVHLIERKGKLGLGTAYIEGFRFSLTRPYDHIIEMDADFSHDPADLPRLIVTCESGEADLCIGSRYVDKGQIREWPLDRIFLSRGASLYVRMLSGMNIKDPTSGFICYSRNVLESINLDKIRFVGYAFQIEMKYAALSLGFRYREIPIVFKDRQKGTSKMNLSIVREAVWAVFQIKLNTFMDRDYYSSTLTQ